MLRILVLFVLAAFLLGCPEPTARLLPPLEASAQLDAINQRAVAIRSLRARASVTLTWTDTNQRRHRDTADGVLVLRYVRPGNAPGHYEVVLFGRVAGQDVFELGENATNYWMAMRVDPKTATVARKADPWDPREHPKIPFRAGIVPHVLGIAPLESAMVPRDHAVQPLGPTVMTNPGSVEVITYPREESRAQPAGLVAGYSFVYSRYVDEKRPASTRLGDLEQVRIYDARGIVRAVSTLSKYGDVEVRIPRENPEDPPQKGPTVRLPYYIKIVYPARDAQVELAIDKYEVGPINAKFAMPDFARQGLKVE